ncbi:hypothetical protein HaLaN_19052 [Haematococcus lacustris]|uniref:Uncharacterized protein n=1 Tax=Haematococcus lacustris TaxID=44745 RepID=A0A699ZI95_HAELA|nr:hypothetical protein HaLaN_19052 [Haematococcus lacustris]
MWSGTLTLSLLPPPMFTVQAAGGLEAGGPRRAGGCAVQLPAPQQLCAGPGPARQQPSTC